MDSDIGKVFFCDVGNSFFLFGEKEFCREKGEGVIDWVFRCIVFLGVCLLIVGFVLLLVFVFVVIVLRLYKRV